MEYSFDVWLNGDLHHLRRGVHYECTTLEMKSMILQAATMMGVRVHVFAGNGLLMVKASTN